MPEQIYIVTRTLWEEGKIEYVGLEKAFKTREDADKYLQFIRDLRSELDCSYEVCTAEY